MSMNKRHANKETLARIMQYWWPFVVNRKFGYRRKAKVHFDSSKNDLGNIYEYIISVQDNTCTTHLNMLIHIYIYIYWTFLDLLYKQSEDNSRLAIKEDTGSWSTPAYLWVVTTHLKLVRLTCSSYLLGLISKYQDSELRRLFACSQWHHLMLQSV